MPLPPANSHVSQGLKQSIPPQLVEELLEAHREAKANFYIGGNRLSGVEAGRFCEAAFRVLQHLTTGQHTPIGKTLATDTIINSLANLPVASHPDSIRLHIPRCLRMVYDVRNKRDLAHLGNGIDPNRQDATLVVGAIDWVLAEFVRLHHAVPADEAHAIIVDIVARSAPSVQDFDGFLKVLRPDLPAGDHCLLLLYERGVCGATVDEMTAWVPKKMRTNLRRTLDRLVDLAFAVKLRDLYQIIMPGQAGVESRKLIEV